MLCAVLVDYGRGSRMIVCRSLFRIDRLLKYTSPFVLQQPGLYACNGWSLNVNKTGKKEFWSAANQKKMRKTIGQAWRPVCTHTSPSKDLLVKDDRDEKADGSQVQEMHCRMHSSTEETNVVTDLTAGSSASPNKDGDTNLEGHSVPSGEKFSVKLDVGSSLVRFVKGKGGSTQERIEKEMGVKVIIPSFKKAEFVVIEGNSVDSVTKASEKIQSIIDEAIRSPSLDYSHFVSLPLAIHPELVEKLINFQNSILETHTQSDSEVDKSIFIRPKTFHLTVLMLKLWNKERVDAAAEVLRGISSKIMDALDNRPVLIRLKGLDCMKGSRAKARVLYAPVEEVGDDERLFRACQIIIEAFTEAGLVLENDPQKKLKLHATVINVRHRKSNKWGIKFDSFDAREIFEQYGSEEWGEYHIREAHLSQRYAFDEDEYYHCCASIPFP